MPSAINPPPNRIRVRSALTLFVSTTGNDSNDGRTASTPFLTIQKAVDVATQQFDFSFTGDVTISIADGTYTLTGSINCDRVVGQGSIVFLGNTTTPANVIITASSGSFSIVSVRRSAVRYSFRGFTLQATGGTHNGLDIGALCQAQMDTLVFGSGLNSQIIASNMALFTINGSYSITAGAAHHIRCSQNSTIIYAVALTVTLTGTPAFTSEFVNSDRSAAVSCPASAITFSGAATGKRYVVATNGLIDTLGGGATYFPGDVAGTSATGGTYN